MTFEAVESSQLGTPTEFLTFRNGGVAWQYTNSSEEETIGARTFTPLAYKRSEPVFSKNTDDGRVKIEIPSNLPIVEFYETIPSSTISTVTIERRHRSDPDGGVQIYWKGDVAAVNRNGEFATVLAVPTTQLPAQVPRYTYSALCNWFLFQDKCGLTREQWRHLSAPILTIDPTDPAILTIDGLRDQAQALADQFSPNQLTAQEIDDYWLGGYIENAFGEKRAIYGTDIDGVPDRIRMIQPFRNQAVTDLVTVYAGCDRTRSTCAKKFNNNLNHGGFPDIPIVNPFTTELPSGTTTAEKKRFWSN